MPPREMTPEERDYAAAFSEWDRRWREEPGRFQSDSERLLAGQSPDDYGAACAPYFAEILREIRAVRLGAV